MEIKFYNDRTESSSQILTRLTNIVNDINGITFSDTSATMLYAIGKLPPPLARINSGTAETLFVEGIQLFNLPRKAHTLHRRDIILKGKFLDLDFKL